MLKTRKNIQVDNSVENYRDGRLICDFDAWIVIDYETGIEYKTLKKQWKIFVYDDLHFDDSHVLYKLVNRKAYIKLKPATVYKIDLTK